MTEKLVLFKGIGDFNFPITRFHEELTAALVACSERRGMDKYVFTNEDISMETNWPYYGGANKNMVALGSWDLKAGENYSRYMGQLLDSAYNNQDKLFVIINMHPFLRLTNYFSGVRNIIIADGCLSCSDRFINNKTISFPAMPVVKNYNQNIVGKRELLASFQGANTHKSRIALTKIASEEIVIKIVKQSGYFNNSETLNSSVISYTKLLNKSTFAFVPRGHALFSYRLLEVMSHGCIPILISDGWILPFDKQIKWNELILRVSEDQINSIPDLLKDFDTHSILQKQGYVNKIYKQYFSNMSVVVDAMLNELELLNQENDVCTRELIPLRKNLEKINYLKGIKIKSDLSGASVPSFLSQLSNKINKLLF